MRTVSGAFCCDDVMAMPGSVQAMLGAMVVLALPAFRPPESRSWRTAGGTGLPAAEPLPVGPRRVDPRRRLLCSGPDRRGGRVV